MGPIFRRRRDNEDITPFPASADGAEVTGLEHLRSLEAFEKAHKLDPNLPLDELNDIDAALATGNAEKGIEIEQALMEDNSPYPEVRTEKDVCRKESWRIASDKARKCLNHF
jgi:hypothetical protein